MALPSYRNTLLADTDMVYRRIPDDVLGDDDLVEIAFEDMEPIEGFDLVGIEPHTAIAILPLAEFDVIGVAPFGAIAATPIAACPRHVLAELEPDTIPTEEYHAWDQDDDAQEAAAL